MRSPTRYAVPAMPCVGRARLEAVDEFEEGVARSRRWRRCRSPGGARASAARGASRAGPPTTTCARGCSRLMSRATSATPRRFAVQHDRPNRSASSAPTTSSTRRQAKPDRFTTFTGWPARSACAPRAKRPYGVWKSLRRDRPPRTRWAGLAADVRGSPGAGIFQGGGYRSAIRKMGSRGRIVAEKMARKERRVSSSPSASSSRRADRSWTRQRSRGWRGSSRRRRDRCSRSGRTGRGRPR